jgi:hypothetical protein
MLKNKTLKRMLLGASILLAGGTVLSNGCMNTLVSIPVCGAILTFCTPGDQLTMFWPYLEVPDYTTDPSCSIPYGCGGQAGDGGTDLFPAIPGAPGGNGSDGASLGEGGGVGGGGGGGV